jgi:hypothetical protein
MMRGKQAKILSDNNFDDLLLFAETGRHALRNRAIVLLSAIFQPIDTFSETGSRYPPTVSAKLIRATRCI